MTTQDPLTSAIRDHYDQLNVFYRAFWGEHIHHGVFRESGESRKSAQIRLIDELIEFAGVPRGASVLDVGCGVGGSSLHLAREHGCRSEGISISPVQVEAAARAAEAAGVADRVRFRELDANDLSPLADEAYDVVWCIECSEHIHDKRRLVEHWHRVLRPGGRVALCAWCEAHGLDDARRAEFIRPVNHGMLLPGMLPAERYCELLEASGFFEPRFEDLTEQVRPTWDLCRKIVERPEVKLLVRVASRSVQQFVESFRAMQRAYANGTMRYARITARK